MALDPRLIPISVTSSSRVRDTLLLRLRVFEYLLLGSDFDRPTVGCDRARDLERIRTSDREMDRERVRACDRDRCRDLTRSGRDDITSSLQLVLPIRVEIVL